MRAAAGMDDEEETYRLWKIRKTIMQVSAASGGQTSGHTEKPWVGRAPPRRRLRAAGAQGSGQGVVGLPGGGSVGLSDRTPRARAGVQGRESGLRPVPSLSPPTAVESPRKSLL